MKKFLPYILILAVVTVGALGPFSAAKSSAATITTTEAIKNPTGVSLSNCKPLPGWFSLDKCVAAASYFIIFMPTSSVLWFAGQIMNISVSFSLDGNTLKVGMVESGWKISRDFVNLLFIFILLYIAIATILQLSGYGMKELLVRIIIIALLVNFSLLITRVVVDASNILAIEFYEKMTTEGGTVAKFTGGEDARSISQVFIDGFDPQKLFNNEDFLTWQKDTVASPLALLMMFILASLMNLVGAFVLFAGAILFIIRIAVLWILMILAPLAFVAMALPATKQYASQWWTKLFHQSFFAPAFLFMFYLVAMMVNPPDGGESFIAVMGKSIAKVSTGKTGIESFFAIISTILLQFIVMTVLMVASIMVAQKMGAVGAGTMQSWGKSAKKWGQAKAGRIGKRYVGRAATAAEGALEKGEGTFAKTLRAIPFFQRGLAKTAQLTKKEVDKYEKDFGSYDTQTLKQLRGKMGTTPEARTAITKILEKKGVEGPKAELIKKENEEVKEINMRLNKHKIGAGFKETDAIEKVSDFYEDKITEFGVALDATPHADEKKRIELIGKKRTYEKLSKNADSLEKRKKEIEANRQRRKEVEEIGERVRAAERKAGEASEKASAKPPPSAPKT